jgi:hypothetical protein
MSRQEADRLYWRLLKGIDLRRLVEARLQAHYAIQGLARIARACISQQPDDGHICRHRDIPFRSQGGGLARFLVKSV